MSIDRSFIRVAADWSAEEALDVLSAVGGVRRAIVHRVDREKEYFYAYFLLDIVARLNGRTQPDATVFEALDLHEYQATPVAADDRAGIGPVSVVVDGGQIVGVAEHLIPERGEGMLRGGPEFSRGIEIDALTRGLAASAPAEIALGSEVSLLVKITEGATLAGSLPLPVAINDSIDVVLEASGAVEIKGAAEATIKVDRAEEIVQRFRIRGRELGDARVKVYVFKGGANIGSVNVVTRVVATVADPGPVERSSSIHPPNAHPDLTVLVFEDKAERTYKMRLTTADARLGLNLAPFGPIVLAGDIEAFFTDFYRDIEAILASTDSARDKVDQLGTKGTYLLEKVMPPDLRKRLWDLRTRIKSVQIQSEEPWVPWELCKLWSDTGGSIEEGGFLSEEFEVTRWFLGMPQYPELTTRSFGLVVPAGSGLPAAPAERGYLLGLARDGRAVTEIPARATDLRAALASANHDALHFTGHGAFAPSNADRSTIALEGARRFSPEDLSGSVANFGRTHPLVFLNACEIGRSGTALGGTAGWPQGFIKSGAGAFIGPFWRIGDGSASLFAQTFYDALLNDGATVGEAVQLGRGAIRRANDPTWLAYVAYAHPDARVVTP